MMSDVRNWPRVLQLASAALALALLLDVGLVVRLVRPREGAAALEPLVLRPTPSIAIRDPGDAELIRQAGNRTPFDAGGVAPSSLLPGVAAVPTAVSPIQPPRLVGTVVEPRGGFVVVEMPDAHMQVVRVGERAGDLRLRSVSAGEAVFEDRAGARITLRSPVSGAETRP